MESLGVKECYLIQLPVFLESKASVEEVIGTKEDIVSTVKQGTDLSVAVFPGNPFMGSVDLHARPSNKLVMKLSQEGENVDGSIVGVGKCELGP